ncbi:MAG: alanine dehydrogenase [Tannerellaceae bacterium]
MNPNKAPIGQNGFFEQEILKNLLSSMRELVIGIPKERIPNETRLALTPEAVGLIVDQGHRVLIERGSGFGINYTDNDFAEQGAEILDTSNDVYQSDIIFKILPPTLEEAEMMKPRATLFSFIQLIDFSSAVLDCLVRKKITAIAYELICDEHQSLPILNAISEIEGLAAISVAADLLSSSHNGKGILLGGVPGVPPTEVVVLGAGLAGTAAAKGALGLGALVKVFDDDVFRLRNIQRILNQQVYTCNFQPNVLDNAFLSADVVIGALHFMTTGIRHVISEEFVKQMKKGAVIVDLRVSRGGCFETTCSRKASDPYLYTQFGVVHYCMPNISCNVARTTAMALSNVFVPMIHRIGEVGGVSALLRIDTGFKKGVYLFDGRLVNRYVANHFNTVAGDLDIFLS